MMHFIKDEREAERQQRCSKGETLCLRLTDEQNLYSEVELCRGAGGGKSGQWIITVGSYTHAQSIHMYVNVCPHTQNYTNQHRKTNKYCMQISSA